ncbi:cytochrome P450 [Trametes versicolor FP-101664 SS1]|uniref:cytochrome P450 n=1 Tax=Trametes versicolor (strain FP-101664) TaxID=717944 RepID=UPI0004623D4E|nr:cytochrome P450 [Trametes versicolor FP-101664 SS1]EIW54990.1 cytochrome P450 [Trametes versicolor FP-101664 SS1]
MVQTLLQGLFVCATTWLLWKAFRKFVVKSDLDNLPGPPSPSFMYGHVRELYNKQTGFKYHRSLGEKYGPVVRLRGRFGSNLVYTFDPKAMHSIAIKDQDIFQEATWFTKATGIIFGPGLFATLGDHHRKQRKMLNPVFSVNHMRNMSPIFYDITHKLRTAIQDRVREGHPAEVNIVSWMGRTALELMGQGGLGYSFDPLIADAGDEYGKALKDLMPTLAQVRGLHHHVPLFQKIVPKGWRRAVAELIPAPPLQRIIQIADTMRIRSTEIFEAKKKALLAGDDALKHQIGEGRDLISVLLRENMAAAEEDKLPEEELIGQMSTMTFAAMDSTSNALSLTLWRLAQHPERQDALRKEILEAKEAHGGGDIGYDELVALPYLDAVCRETLRVHTPAPFRFRETNRDVILPLSEPVRGKDGRMMHELHIPKNTSVFVGINASNTNPALWGPDAYEWKPERWLEPLPETVLNARIPGVYANLMTFWGGGRSCVGFKFSQLEMKVVLAVLLSTFTFELTEKPIYWNMATVQYPSTDPHGAHPELPMKVGLLRRDSVRA